MLAIEPLEKFQEAFGHNMRKYTLPTSIQSLEGKRLLLYVDTT